MIRAPGTVLADRLGKTTHVSPLRYKLARLRREWPCPTCRCIEDWLVAVANARGARAVVLPDPPAPGAPVPDERNLSNEELVTALCQPNCLDRPQILRLAAQLISGGAVDPQYLCFVAKRERAEPVLAELSRQALKVDPHHAVWQAIAARLRDQRALAEPILHWTRLAEPIMGSGGYNADRWELVR